MVHSTERDLADDAQWKRIQQNTFTRWANEQLRHAKSKRRITNLETDFQDGLVLIALVQVLSGKYIKNYHKKPSYKSQKLENISHVLTFLQDVEKLKIVNIGK